MVLRKKGLDSKYWTNESDVWFHRHSLLKPSHKYFNPIEIIPPSHSLSMWLVMTHNKCLSGLNYKWSNLDTLGRLQLWRGAGSKNRGAETRGMRPVLRGMRGRGAARGHHSWSRPSLCYTDLSILHALAGEHVLLSSNLEDIFEVVNANVYCLRCI